MVNLRTTLLIFGLYFSLFFAVSAVGQTTHFFYSTVGAGYSTLKYRSNDFRSLGNVGANVGVGYEFQTSGGFVFSLGACFDALNNTSKHHNFVNDRLLLDTDGLQDGTAWYDSVMFHTDFHKFRETQSLGYVSFPLLLGARFNRFTLLVGGKIGLSLYSHFVNRALITTTGTYQWFNEDFHDMENHFYVTEHKIENSGALSVGLDAEAVAQFYVSCTPSRWQNTQLHVGLFANYGFLNLNKEKTDSQLITYHENPLDISLVSQLQSTQLASKNISPLTVGICAKFLFELGTSTVSGRPHRHCNCINGFNHSKW